MVIVKIYDALYVHAFDFKDEIAALHCVSLAMTINIYASFVGGSYLCSSLRGATEPEAK